MCCSRLLVILIAEKIEAKGGCVRVTTEPRTEVRMLQKLKDRPSTVAISIASGLVIPQLLLSKVASGSPGKAPSPKRPLLPALADSWHPLELPRWGTWPSHFREEGPIGGWSRSRSRSRTMVGLSFVA